jgi:hypothetical protein
MLVYLGCCAVLACGAALAAALATVPPAPTFHLAFAAGAMPLVFGAIIHFVPVLTRSGTPPRHIRLLPLAVQGAGLATPLALAGVLPYWGLHVAASAVALAALAMIVWISRCLRATLGAPHPGARWYGAALLCLFFAVSLVPVWLALPELRIPLRLFHLHLNTLGFIGLAALGTLPVLLPTALKRPDAEAATRLRKDLLPAVGGALLVAAGAASASWLALPGVALLSWVVGRNLLAWRRGFGWRAIGGDGAAMPLTGATAGFALLLVLGVAHGGGWLPARPAIAGFAALFLLPLVTGALSQLLPVWRHPGPDSPRRRALRERLVRGGGWRAALFCIGGILLTLDVPLGVVGAAAGLAFFAANLIRAFWLDRPGASDDNRALP